MAESSIVVGSIIAGKYRVERVLGEGGTACVVEATNLELGQSVAIKMLLGEQNQTPDMMQRFRREARITAKLSGEHITRVVDLGWTEDNEPFIVMELLKGQDIQYEIDSRGPLPIEEAVDLVMQACEGVAEAHAAGLVHRDLKPGNLFLTRRIDGTPLVKVLDFGISKVVDGSGNQLTTTNFSGTPLYMSPEQIKNPRSVDARTDQHALGAILYTLLSGHPPYNADSTTGLSVVIATTPPPRITDEREDVPEELEQAIQKALGKSPEDRFGDLAGLARAIAPFGTESSVNSLRSVTSTLAPAKVVIEGAPISNPRGPITGNLKSGPRTGQNLRTGQRTGNQSAGLKTVVSPHRKARQRMRWVSVVAVAAAVAGSVILFTKFGRAPAVQGAAPPDTAAPPGPVETASATADSADSADPTDTAAAPPGSADVEAPTDTAGDPNSKAVPVNPGRNYRPGKVPATTPPSSPLQPGLPPNPEDVFGKK